MKPTKRKLSLNTQTLRHLTTQQLGRVHGGVSSLRDNACSTDNDTGCTNCDSSECIDAITIGPACSVGCGSN